MPEGIQLVHSTPGLRLLTACNYLHDDTAPSKARTHALDAAGDLTDPDRLCLCVSELVTNSVRHARRGPVTMLLWHLFGEGLLRCEVIDCGGLTVPTTSYSTDDMDLEMGRGLFLVENTAISWGTYADQAGRTTWCVLVAARVGGRQLTGRVKR